MIKKIQIVGIIGAIIASIVILSSPTNPLPLPEPLTSTNDSAIQILATNLDQPRSIAFGNEQIFVTEKEGKIRIIQNDTLLEKPLATFRVADVFNGGLLGITTHPNFIENNLIYVYYTYYDGETFWNKVSRLQISNNTVLDVVTILDDIPGSRFNNGGDLEFGPDDKLYISTGITSDSSHNAQDVSSLEGKILRINHDGTIPDDNPFPNSPVFSLGHRNPQGITWNSSGVLFIADLGPEKNDEINIINSGKNYGWPETECDGTELYVKARICFDPGIEPGGITFYNDDKLELDGMLIMASLRSTNLYKLDMSQDVVVPKSILSGVGRIRDVAVGPNGYLYVITSNTDGKGFPSNSDDMLIRIMK